jgi:hypothetical protein
LESALLFQIQSRESNYTVNVPGLTTVVSAALVDDGKLKTMIIWYVPDAIDGSVNFTGTV